MAPAVKTEQQKEGEKVLEELARKVIKKEVQVRSATVVDELNRKGGQRIVIFTEEVKDESRKD